MTAIKIVRTVALGTLLSFATAGAAFADSTSTVGITGPNSSITITENNSTVITENNVNNTTVTNNNVQSGTSGSAVVAGNTFAGAATTGDVSNNYSATTSIAIGNTSAIGGMGSGPAPVGGSGGGGSVGGGGSADTGSSATVTVGGSGSGYGAWSDASTLPEVGCSTVCDVSAYRAAYTQPNNSVAAAVQEANKVSGTLMALAALLSLVGAAGSAMVAIRRSRA